MKLIFTVLLFISTLTAFPQNRIDGIVIDQADGEGIPGATVEIKSLGRAVITNPDGTFTIPGIPEGTYEFRISHVSYMNVNLDIDIPSEDNIEIRLEARTFMAEEVIVKSTRAGKTAPVTYSEMNQEEIKNMNQGQDLPFVLNFMPSVVTTSDAGAGIGYTGIRIRGSDATRINVTINGVPLNDSESQGVYWVDIPDIASSTQSIQVQRGVGTSTNGAGAFGGTINLQTNHLDADPYAELINGIGSFGTRRHTLNFGTGLLKQHWAIDGRLSKIESNGYIDRASSDLDSYYFSAGYYGKKTIVKALMFGGDERTYQSWYGTPEAVLDNDAEGIENVIINNGLDEEQAENMRTAGRTFNWYLYENQVDDYQQDHYQLHASHRFSDRVTAQVALHYTYGRGFYEQYRRDDDYADYGLDDVVVGGTVLTSTDLVRRRWLDNDFYGMTYALMYKPGNSTELTLGGGWNRYSGGHFGEIIWTETAAGNVPKDYRYYDNTGDKDDFNTYLKAVHQLNRRWQIFGDLQFRRIDYAINGVDNDLRALDLATEYNFFNPKAGLSFMPGERSTVYASFAVANREPVRTDFIDNPETPEPERLNNLEIGYRLSGSMFSFEANGYWMGYRDQLVLTGELNDVGSPLRRNVADSYRAGIELQVGWSISPKFSWQANATFSSNKIKSFTEVIYDYGPAFDEFNVIENIYKNTDIAYSPSVIAASQLTWKVLNGAFHSEDRLEVSLLSKYVGDQYLDNTSNESRKIDDYFVNDLRLRYSIENWVFSGIDFTLQVNNVFSERFSSNGYTFGYQGGPDYVVRENYYYPQALANYMITLGIRI